MRCPVCSQDNPESNWFCSKCLASLRQKSLQNQHRRRVYLVGDTLEVPPARRSGSKPRSGGGGAIILIVFIAGLLYLIYG